MKPALTGPYLLRAEVYLKLGSYTLARKDLERFDESPRLNDLNRSIDRGEAELRLANEAQKAKNWRSVAERASSILKNYSPGCGEAADLLQSALLQMDDKARAKKLLVPSSMNPCFLAKFYFSTGDFSDAKKNAELCEAPEAKKLGKTIAEIAKDFETAEGMLLRPSIAALESLQKRLKTLEFNASGAMGKINNLLCLKYAKVKNASAAIPLCRECLKTDPQNTVDYSLALSEALQQQEEFEEAVSVLEAAAKKHKDNRLQEAIKAAQKARHEAANPDYYKLLGVPRDASEKQIKLAYRKLAQKYHPDKLKNSTPEEKKRAEVRMGLINRANDVLTDPEKRAQYDRGFDPENPQGHQPFGHGGGHPFGFGGHHQQAGGGVPFEFIFEALRQQQAGGQRRGGHGGGQFHQQFHFNFHDEL